MLRASYATAFLLLVLIIASAPTLVNANGEPEPALLHIAVYPAGGGTTNPEAGITIPVYPDKPVWVTAYPASGYAFDHWELEEEPIGSANPLEFIGLAGPLHLVAVFRQVLWISIDIKPGGYPNSINLKNKGVVPVAVLTTTTFDASTVDPSTVTFAGASPAQWTLKDVDGDLDLVLQFKTQDLKALTSSSTQATLTGWTYVAYGHIPIEGADTVNIVK